MIAKSSTVQGSPTLHPLTDDGHVFREADRARAAPGSSWFVFSCWHQAAGEGFAMDLSQHASRKLNELVNVGQFIPSLFPHSLYVGQGSCPFAGMAD